MRKRVLASFILLYAIVLLSGCTHGGQDISVADAWARPGRTGGNSAVYFTITNALPEADTLLGVEGVAADSVELHRSSLDASGTMRMRPVESVPLAAESTVTFETGGLHVMLVGLKQDLSAGDTLRLTLDFQNHPDLTLDVRVREIPEVP